MERGSSNGNIWSFAAIINEWYTNKENIVKNGEIKLTILEKSNMCIKE
jgi:hypothetical protein